MPELSIVQQIAVWMLPVLLAVTLHEAAHGWVAYRLGDSTAKMLGRLSFNPLRHIDIIGTIIVPLVILALSNFNFVFGWAKPVPINTTQLKHPRRDIALITAAGPLSNLLMALGWISILKLIAVFNTSISTLILFVVLMTKAGVVINLLLFVFNLLPIPPLDGSKIVASLLPIKQAIYYEKLEPFGMYILVALLLTGVVNELIGPPINSLFQLISRLYNL